MTYTTATPILGTGSGDPDAIAAWAIAKGAARPDDVRAYLDTVYRMAPPLGINPDLVVAQSIHETTDLGIPWNSVWWRSRVNPAGIGITGDPRQNAISRDFLNGEAAARAHLLHLYLYAVGDTVPDGFQVADDPRWEEAREAGYAGFAATLENLNGTWAIDPQDNYDGKLAGRLNDLQRAGLIGPATGEEPEEGHGMAASHKYILSMGHHNTNRGGAAGEFGRVQGWTQKLKAAIIKRGGQAWIIQEEDGDGNPVDFVNGGLQTAASRCVTLASRVGPVDAYISMHHNSSPGYHGLFPDSPSGGIDVKGNNPLDVRLCRNIRDAVKKIGGPILSWTDDSPGVMSERESRVGEQGNRLGEFVGTYGFRQTTARVILEGSGNGDPRIDNPTWVNAYVEAIVDGLETTFGAFREAGGGGGQPEPDPVPEPTYPAADPIAALADSPAYHEVKNASGKVIAQLIRTDYKVTAIRDTPRLKYADDDSVKIGPDVKAGSVFEVIYLILNADGGKFWYSPYATRFRFEDAVPYFADTQDDPDVVDG